MGAARADADGLAVPARAVGRDARAGARGLRRRRQRDRRVRAGDDDRQPGERRARARGRLRRGRRGRRAAARRLVAARLRADLRLRRRRPSAIAVHFGFNAWGEKFAPWDRDAAVGGPDREQLGDEVVRAPIVLEGGSILSDGAGTLLTTEQCLLNPNRNPSLVARARSRQVLRGGSASSGSCGWPGAGRGPRHRRPRRPDRRVRRTGAGAAADRRSRQPELRALRGEPRAAASTPGSTCSSSRTCRTSRSRARRSPPAI